MSDSLSSESVLEILAQADAAREAASFEVAAKLYTEAGTQSGDKDLVVTSADGLQTCGKETAAITVLEGAVDRWPTSPMLLMRAVIAYENTSNYAGAARHLRKITELFPAKARYWVRLGDAYAASGNWYEAEAAFAQTLAIAPLDPSAAVGRGGALVQLGRIEDAIACYRRVITLLPDHADAILKLGSLLSSVGKLEEAAGFLRRAISHNPKSAAAHVTLGTTLHYSGSAEEGLTLCRKAVELEPNLSITREAVGILLLDSGRVAEAAEALAPVERATASIPGLIAMYTVESLAGNMDAAERALQRVLTLDPRNGEARHLLAAMHGEPMANPAPRFVESIFAQLAQRFDERMINDLTYQMPQHVASEILNMRGQATVFSRWIDLGCGTGLIASALDGVLEIREKIGIDITQAMLSCAARKNLYHHLIQGDVTDALGEIDGSFDLITAIDLFPYLGELKEFLPRVASRLAPDGLFIYTHELAQDGTYKLRPAGRFAHSFAYLERLTSNANMKTIATKRATLLYDKGEEVPGQIVILSPRV